MRENERNCFDEFRGFHGGVVVDDASVGNWFQTFRRNIFKGCPEVSKLLKWTKYAYPKLREPLTHWRGVISQKDAVLKSFLNLTPIS
jgi:hypothetical protein